MYEHRGERPLSPPAFRRRLARHVAVAALVGAASLAGGTAGYARFAGLDWPEALLHAAMLLSGMGLVAMPTTPAAKLFVAAYALFAGLVYLVVTGIVVAPLVHRLLHRFHWDAEG